MASIDKSQWHFSHTMLRIKNPEISLEFYSFLGMILLEKTSMPWLDVDSYHLSYRPARSNSDPRVSVNSMNRECGLELLHTYGSENNTAFAIANGNEEQCLGYGHICISVDNLAAACDRLERRGCKFQKKLTDGPNSHMAFVLDPDGYWIELVSNQPLANIVDLEATDPSRYLLNHTMLRVLDPQRTQIFYQEILGMHRLWTLDLRHIQSRFDFYGFCEPGDSILYGGDLTKGENPVFHRQGVLELKCSDADKRHGTTYQHGNGKSARRGFGHICITVDNLEQACQYLGLNGVVWIKRLHHDPASEYAIIADPDGYWVKVIQEQKDWECVEE